MTYTLEAEGLSKSYGDTTVLDGLDLQVEAGTVYALLGPNGAGKTTTVRILSHAAAGRCRDGDGRRLRCRDPVRGRCARPSA